MLERTIQRSEFIVPKSGDLVGPDPVERDGLLGRLLSGKVALLLVRNTVVSCAVFAFGIVLLWVLVQFLGMAELPAVALSFVAANSIHYAFSRIWIFAGTLRPAASGYLLFFINAGVGLIVTMALFWVLTELLSMNYLVARVIASLFAGLASFLLNATVNFGSV